MQLRELIGKIGAKYDRRSPSVEALRLLRKAEAECRQWIPSGHLVQATGGDGGTPAVTPGIAILNPDETTTIRRGMYVAYLFAADKSTVTLSLNQGIIEMGEHLGRAGARLVLALEAATIRAVLGPAEFAGLDLTFDLHTEAAAALDYEHANIVSCTYRLDSLPREREMQADLQRFMQLYASALRAREVARRHGRHELIVPAAPSAKAESAAKTEPSPKAKPSTKSEPPAKAEPAAKAESPVKVEPAVKAEAPTEVKVAVTAAAPAETTPAGKVKASSGTAKILTGSATRRGVLAALVAAPIAYVAPRAVASRDPETAVVVAEESGPPQPAPVFTVDVSQHDWKRRGGNLDWAGIRQAGIAGMCARATYGDPSGYNWPTYHFGDFARAAKSAGMSVRGGYHNLVRGDQDSINRQVDWLRRELDKHDANWGMLDVERYAELVKAEMWPRWEDVRRFDDRWAEVDGRVLVGYIPPWNWSKHLGQPDLREFRGPLIASNYPLQNANEDFKQLYDKVGGNGGRGWAAYGSRTPEGWQYSARAKVPGAPYICDINAWRMTSTQLRALLLTKRKSA